MDLALNDIGLLIVAAAAVAMVARRLGIPYAVGLLLTGGALAAAGLAPGMRLSRELIYIVFLPPLVFEAALFLDWQELRRDLPVIGTLATAGVLISGAIIAAGMHYIAEWPVAASICFGSLIAATDPVSVIATFKDAGVKGRVRLLVEAESLLNDCTAAILFGLAIEYSMGGATTPGSIALSLLVSIGGGIAAGAIVAGGALLLAGKTSEHVVQVTLTAIAAYGSFLAAERFHASGVLASLTAGLILGNAGIRGPVSATGREAVIAFWEFAAFVVNSLVFLLIGVQVAHERIADLLLPSAIAVALVLLSRAVAIYPLSALFSRSALRVTTAHQHILFWGGLRGALALALALGLPASLPGREAVVTVTLVVAAFSIIVQGLTMPPLLRRVGGVTAGEAGGAASGVGECVAVGVVRGL
jgi:CPA1 family monovalent cation:H+ antiporter